MSKIEFLDSDKKVGKEHRETLIRAEDQTWEGDYAGALETVAPIVEGADALTQGFARVQIGDVHLFEWRFSQADREYAQAEKHFRSARHKAGPIFITFRRADLATHYALTREGPVTRTPQTKAIRTRFERAFKSAQQMKHDFLVGFGHHYRGYIAFAEQDFSTAIKELERAIQIRTRIKDDRHRLSSQTLLAVAHAAQDQFEQAHRIADDTLGEQLNAGMRPAALRTLAAKAQIAAVDAHGTVDSVISEINPVQPFTHSPFTREIGRNIPAFQGATMDRRVIATVLSS